MHDTAVALTTLEREGVSALHSCALGRAPLAAPGAAASRSTSASAASFVGDDFAERLCEGDGSLLPPYGAQLLDWTEPDGSLAIAIRDRKLALCDVTVANLVFIDERSLTGCVAYIAPALQIPVLTAVLRSLAGNGVGVPRVGGARGHDPPTTYGQALHSVPAFRAVLDELDKAQYARDGSDSQSSIEAWKKVGYNNDARYLGWDFVLWIRHLQSHVFFGATSLGRTVGLNAAVVATAVRAAAHALAAAASTRFEVNAATRLLRDL